jgi:hypothetical protein
MVDDGLEGLPGQLRLELVPGVYWLHLRIVGKPPLVLGVVEGVLLASRDSPLVLVQLVVHGAQPQEVLVLLGLALGQVATSAVVVHVAAPELRPRKPRNDLLSGVRWIKYTTPLAKLLEPSPPLPASSQQA